MKIKETYYLVHYIDIYGDKENEGVFTEKGWKKYIKQQNTYREASEERLFDESWEENMEFIFTEIEVYN